MPAASKAKPKEKPEPAKAAGDRDAQHLQERLRQLGYGVKVDGARGPRTAAAVKLFQKDHGLRADGVVGPRTKAAMRGSSKEAIDEIRKGSKGKPAGEEAAGGASSSGGGASSAVSSPRKRVEVRSGEHRVVVYEGAEQPPRWATLVEDESRADFPAGGVQEAKVKPEDCSMDHAKLGKKGLPRCPKCGSQLGATPQEAAELVGSGWLLVEGFDQGRLRRLTLDALDGLDEATLEESAKTAALSVTPSPFSASRTSNWVARVGGLPPYIQNVAKALVRSKHSVSEAIQMAIGIVKRWASGEGKVHGEVKAAAAKAIASWEKKRAQSHAQSAAKAA